jgi:hypothetical protein
MWVLETERQVIRLLAEVLDGYSREGSSPDAAAAIVARGLRKAGMRPGLLDDALATLAAQGRV